MPCRIFSVEKTRSALAMIIPDMQCRKVILNTIALVFILCFLAGCDKHSLPRPRSHPNEMRGLQPSAASASVSGLSSDPAELSEVNDHEEAVLNLAKKMKFPAEPDERDKLIALMKRLSETDMDLMNKLVLSLPSEIVVSILGGDTVFNSYLCANSREIMQLLDATPWKKSNGNEVKKIVTVMAVVHPREIVSWLSDKDESPFLNDMVRSVFATAASRDGQNVERLLSELGNSDLRIPALRGIGAILGATDFPKAAEILGREDTAIREMVLPSVVSYMSVEHPMEAWNYANSSIDQPDNPVLVKCAQTIGGRFYLKDRQNALTWIDGMENEAVRAGAIEGFVKTWCANDIVSAGEWLASQPPGIARDAGARVIIEQIENTDPEMAEQWRKSLSPQVSEKN